MCVLHIDFAGPYRNKKWMLLIDTHNKWPEVHAMNSTMTEAIRPDQVDSQFIVRDI